MIEEYSGAPKVGSTAGKGKTQVRKVLGTVVLIYPALLYFTGLPDMSSLKKVSLKVFIANKSLKKKNPSLAILKLYNSHLGMAI